MKISSTDNFEYIYEADDDKYMTQSVIDEEKNRKFFKKAFCHQEQKFVEWTKAQKEEWEKQYKAKPNSKVVKS